MPRGSDRDQAIDAILRRQHALGRRMAHARSLPLIASTLTMQQLKLLLVLAVQDDLATADLAGRMQVKLATLTGIVDRLVRRGLVSRREDEQDRRVRRVSLTRSGHELVDDLQDAGESAFRELLEESDTATLRGMERSLESLLDAADRLGWTDPRPSR